MKSAIDALDNRYKMSQVCKTFQIRRSRQRDHYKGRTKSRKLGPQGVLTSTEEKELLTYLDEMVNRISCPLNITWLKAKVGEITQTKLTPFTNGIPRKSWIKIKNRNPDLVLRVPKGLDLNRARALCPQNVERFYQNLKDLCDQYHYEPHQIWNYDEIGAQANKNDQRVVIARKGTRSVHTIVPNERQWILVLVCVLCLATMCSKENDLGKNIYIYIIM